MGAPSAICLATPAGAPHACEAACTTMHMQHVWLLLRMSVCMWVCAGTCGCVLVRVVAGACACACACGWVAHRHEHDDPVLVIGQEVVGVVHALQAGGGCGAGARADRPMGNKPQGRIGIGGDRRKAGASIARRRGLRRTAAAFLPASAPLLKGQ